MVDVAQLVEPRIVIPAVAGSSPVVHPTLCFAAASRGYCDSPRSRLWAITRNLVFTIATGILRPSSEGGHAYCALWAQNRSENRLFAASSGCGELQVPLWKIKHLGR
jgi:hypothetical protein